MSTNSFPTPKEKALAKKVRPKSVLKDTLPTPRFRGMASTLPNSHITREVAAVNTGVSDRKCALSPGLCHLMSLYNPGVIPENSWWVTVCRPFLRILALFQTKKCNFSDLASKKLLRQEQQQKGFFRLSKKSLAKRSTCSKSKAS